MKRLIHGLALVAALAPLSWAQAQVSYSYLEGSFTFNEVDTGPLFGEEDAAGVDLQFSYEIERFLHLFGGYRFVDFDEQPLEQELAEFGVGFNLDLTANQSVFFNLSALTVDLTLEDPALGTLTADDDAVGFSIGYRETNHTRLEYTMSLDYVEFDEGDTSDTSMDISLQYEITPRLKVLGGIVFGGDDNNWRAGVRYYLPGRFNRE